MDCKKASDFMMKYIDNNLNEAEAKKLNDHFHICKVCKEDFRLYDQIITEFTTEIVNAPESIETSVMETIKMLPPIISKAKARLENVICIIWSLFSIFLGIGFMAIIHKDVIVSYFSENVYLKQYLNMLQPISNYVDNFTTSFVTILNSSILNLSSVVDSLRYILLIIFGFLAVLQYYNHKKSKVEV